jgi:hypothetical protein
MRLALTVIICCFGFFSNAQTLDWWAQTVKWDGVSPWTRYIIYQPAYLGPNALPVPVLSNGDIDSTTSLAAGMSLHFSKGDNTKNISLSANYCLVKDLISFDVAWVPKEWYQMDHATKEERHVYAANYFDNRTAGDIHLNTNIRVLKRWQKIIQLAMRIGYRFPSGSDLGSARYSDGPGYYFDLSFGKPISPSVKWTGMAGFYCWQIESEYFKQDDAFLFGTGLEFNRNNWRAQSYVAGYLGYMEKSGDKPIVWRVSLEKRAKTLGGYLKFQRGLHDFDYTSIETGARYYFKQRR